MDLFCSLHDLEKKNVEISIEEQSPEIGTKTWFSARIRGEVPAGTLGRLTLQVFREFAEGKTITEARNLLGEKIREQAEKRRDSINESLLKLRS